MSQPRYRPPVDELKRRNDLMVTAAFARNLARIAAGLDDPEVCDDPLLLELLALADRAEEALSPADAAP